MQKSNGSNLKNFRKENLKVKVFSTRKEMGFEAAKEVAARITQLLIDKEEINIAFAAAPSQIDFFEYLTIHSAIEWNRINAFHLDEYIGLSKSAPQGFGNFLQRELFGRVDFKNVYLLNGQANDLEKECQRYSSLIKENPLDIVCMGIGENGHIAFNDPHVADFNDPLTVKSVELDLACREQQVNDKCFKSLEFVPTHALTLTIPTLMEPDYIFCMVPSKNKAKAVRRALEEKIEEECPASILRIKKKAILYLDEQSASLVNVQTS